MEKRRFKVYKCFSNRQKRWLMDRGFEYVTIAKDPNTGCLFWLFLKDELLDKALEEYKPYEV